MSEIFEFIFQVLIEFISEKILKYMLKYPGAFIRWLFLQKKKTFKEIYNSTGYNFNYLISIIL